MPRSCGGASVAAALPRLRTSLSGTCEPLTWLGMAVCFYASRVAAPAPHAHAFVDFFLRPERLTQC